MLIHTDGHIVHTETLTHQTSFNPNVFFLGSAGYQDKFEGRDFN